MKQKTALITGASRGIGKAAAKVFASSGYHLLLNCKKNTALLESLCKELSEAYKIRCIPFTGDVSDHETCVRMFETAQTQLGGIDVLVNNAGISHVGLVNDLTPEEWNRIIQTNLSSVFYCSKLAIPHMLSQKQGKIINVSSLWGNVGASCEVAYSASKGGVNAFTKALAKELAPSNIQVNAAAFGAIDTDMNSHLTENDLHALQDEIPAGRLGTPKEAAALLLQLAQSPDYLTGQIIEMSGGWY